MKIMNRYLSLMAFIGALMMGNTSVFAAAVATWYDHDTQIVYAITDGGSPKVYSVDIIWGNCIGTGEVRFMKFLPEKQIDVSFEAELKALAKTNGLAANGLASFKTSASYTTPAVYYYNFTGFTKNLYFNVVTKKGNSFASSGWQPDGSGECTYKIPIMEIEYLYNDHVSYFGRKSGNPYSCYNVATCQPFNTGKGIAVINSTGELYYYDGSRWNYYGYR